jgi:hypothetical protein
MPLTIFCPALRFCLFVFLICVLLAKMNSSFDADGSEDARPEDKISDFEAYLLGKDASESYQTRDEFYKL